MANNPTPLPNPSQKHGDDLNGKQAYAQKMLTDATTLSKSDKLKADVKKYFEPNGFTKR